MMRRWGGAGGGGGVRRGDNNGTKGAGSTQLGQPIGLAGGGIIQETLRYTSEIVPVAGGVTPPPGVGIV